VDQEKMNKKEKFTMDRLVVFAFSAMILYLIGVIKAEFEFAALVCVLVN